MLSDRMRDMMTPPFPEGTNYIGVGKETVMAWATEVAALEAQLAALREATKFYNPRVDGLISACVGCGTHPIPFDYVVSDELWQKVVPEKRRADVICIDCFENLAGGIPEDDFVILYYTGKAGTSAFVPMKALQGETDA